ncbi:hypothetical protein GCM10009798_02210 [Nocardioides panacihumi]|uniref:Uncharacterized protein n=1 Tax=Nocardioides panacihumi TaxID=400774 RepID=A0ABN2Q8R1_9ACTN
MKSSIPVALLLGTVIALVGAGCDSDSESQPAPADVTPTTRPTPTSAAPSPGVPDPTTSGSTLAAPEIDPANAVLAKNSGSGTMSRPQRLETDGSFMFYADCAGGTEMTVVSSDGSETPVPCTGYTSRMRYVGEGRHAAYHVVADPGVEWAITWTDYSP